MTKYVVGFLFDNERRRVVLIRKLRPHWQKGCLNGVGGKIEGIEAASEAMVREFKEETGAIVYNWNYVAVLQGSDFVVHVFSAADTDALMSARTMTDESVVVLEVNKLLERNDVISNLHWLIPLCRNPSDVSLPVQIDYP